MRTWRWLIGGLLVLTLASCGIFFAPLEGRWNPLDPSFGEGYKQNNLYPTVDGKIMNPSSVDFTSTYMIASDTYRAMMKFDTADFPKDIPHAELRLYLSSGGGTYAFRVRLILQDWDPATVSYNQATTEGFLAPLFSPAIVLSSPGFYSWDVTALLRSVTPDSMKGLLVEPAEGLGTAEFYTTDNATNQPYLVIWTR
jgi:hypothetical protein